MILEDTGSSFFNMHIKFLMKLLESVFHFFGIQISIPKHFQREDLGDQSNFNINLSEEF